MSSHPHNRAIRQHGVGVLRSRVLALGAAVTLSLAAQMLPAQESPSETQLKAAFLVNFPKYVEWPSGVFVQTNSPIVVAVLGESNLDGELRKMTENKVIKGRPVTFRRLTGEDEISGCHVLFISAEQQRRSPGILARLKDASVLTVGESGDFLENGGMINLARRDREIALEVNLAAVGKARLKISSKLLSVASVVKGKPN